MSQMTEASRARLIPLLLVGFAVLHEGITAQSARSDQFTVIPDPNPAKASSPAPQRAAGYHPVKAYEFSRLLAITPSSARLTVGTAQIDLHYGANIIHVIGAAKGASGVPLTRGKILTEGSAPQVKEKITFTSDNPEILRFPSPESDCVSPAIESLGRK